MADNGKTAFGFAKKAAKRKDVGVNERTDDGAKKEFLTGVTGSGLELKDKVEKVIKSIPVQENTFEVGSGRRRKAPSFIPDESAIDADNKERFENADLLAKGETAQHDVVYGLTKMGPKDEDTPKAKAEEKPAQESFIGKSLAEKELQAFKEDVEDLPEQATLDDYEQMPIEDFGAAMLRGMGWEEGKPVGRNNNGMVAAVEFVPRSGRLGLGADPAPSKQENTKKYIKPGESREAPATMVLAKGPEGQSRNVKTLDEKLVKLEEPGAREGKRMCVVEGRHRGLTGRVLKVVKQEGRSDRAQLELDTSGEVVTIRTGELADLGTRDADRAMRKKDDRAGGKKDDRAGGKRDDGEGGKKRERSDRDDVGGAQKREKREEPAWLFASTRVRIVSKSFQGGKYYLKKASVVDVLTPRTCALQLEGGEVLTDVPQRALETALPKRGGAVVVLVGEHRGQRGTMLDKKGEVAAVQLSEELSVHKISLDHIAEYTGALED
tara:strand:+ start:3856 stop:5337 length:1482 start_codon:yes stop_codon:yes gene_type:complete